MAATPGSALGYVPFDEPPEPPSSAASALYADYVPPSCAATPFAETPSPEDGVFLSAAEVVALKQWATDREALHERLRAAEDRAAARDEEIAALRARLAQSEGVLEHAYQQAAAPATSSLPQRPPLKPVLSLAPRRSAAEANAMGTQRSAEMLSKREAEVADLTAQWRLLREARGRATRDTGSGGEENCAAAVR